MQWLIKLLDWYKQYRLDLIAAKTKQQNRQFELMAEVVDKQSSFMNKWLESFNITDLPASTVVRDIDQWRAEQDRDRFGDTTNELPPDLRQSISNALRSGAFPDLQEML